MKQHKLLLPVDQLSGVKVIGIRLQPRMHLHVRILDGIETLCIGAVLAEAVRIPRGRHALFPDIDADVSPHLADALAANDVTVKEMFAERIRSFLYGVQLERDSLPAARETSA